MRSALPSLTPFSASFVKANSRAYFRFQRVASWRERFVSRAGGNHPKSTSSSSSSDLSPPDCGPKAQPRAARLLSCPGKALENKAKINVSWRFYIPVLPLPGPSPAWGRRQPGGDHDGSISPSVQPQPWPNHLVHQHPKWVWPLFPFTRSSAEENKGERNREEPGCTWEQIVYQYFPRGISSSLKRTKPEGPYREILVGALVV